MSTTVTLRCRHCGSTFSRTFGIGYNGTGTLYCSQCGRAQSVDLSGGWEPVPDCECGGHFDADAMGNCPQCGQPLTKEEIVGEE